MKKTIILLYFLASFGNLCYSQKNVLSNNEVLKINGIDFEDVKNTYGDENSMKKLFGEDLTVKKSNEPTPRVSFWNDDIYCSFEGDNRLNLVYLRLKNNSAFLIKNKSVQIGYPINKLGEVEILDIQSNNSIGMILFIPLEGYCDCSFSIQFSKETKLIEKIEYNSW